jgi:diadenosine tetraphosphatase ApaH/serine/threonine PP2A family protein phosphatase
MCECKVGPGKFEGEPALAYLLWADGFADESTDQVDWFRGPFQASDDARYAAEAYGSYCLPCIALAQEDSAYGASLYESDQGFVYLVTYPTALEYDAAFAEAEAADAENGEDY